MGGGQASLREKPKMAAAARKTTAKMSNQRKSKTNRPTPPRINATVSAKPANPITAPSLRQVP